MQPSFWRSLWVLAFLLLCGVAHAGKVTYIYTDPQGTPIAEADEQGNITKTFDYRPYGQQALGEPPNGPGYTGHVNDPDTGLVYMQARYYDPEMGRFLSVDPVGSTPGDVFGFNRYAYAHNNPILNIDPDGRETGPAYAAIYRLDGGVPQTYISPDDKVGGAIQAGLGLLPIIGDGANIADAIQHPSAISISAAVVGMAPEVGGAAASALKEVAAVKTAAKLGEEGEAAVRATYDIGKKQPIKIDGRTRIPDGVTKNTLSEVKNVGKLSFTQQLRDYKEISEERKLQFNLYTRPDTQLSRPLQDQVDRGFIKRVDIPGQ